MEQSAQVPEPASGVTSNLENSQEASLPETSVKSPASRLKYPEEDDDWPNDCKQLTVFYLLIIILTGLFLWFIHNIFCN